MKYMEIESKYNAQDLCLTDFSAFCESQGAQNHIIASGWDHFYSTPKVQGFARHRIGPNFNQLTYKRKTSGSNNFIREEDNIDLLVHTTRDQVQSFMNKLSYKHNKSIYKNCFIYKFPKHTLVYYVIYDESIHEIGRFIEIEMSEDHPWESEAQAWNSLVEIEKTCKPIGIVPQARMRRSLYEIVCES